MFFNPGDQNVNSPVGFSYFASKFSFENLMEHQDNNHAIDNCLNSHYLLLWIYMGIERRK